jgi:hypothetical protein
MEENDVINVDLPADLSTLSDEALETQRTNAKAAFNAINSKSELSAEDEATLETLVEAKLALDAEKARRAQLAADKLAKRAAAAAAFADGPADDEDAEEEAAPAAPAAPAEPEEVEASAAPKPISVKALKARQAPVDLTPAAPAKPFRAGSGAVEFNRGEALTLDQVAEALAASTNPTGLRQTVAQAHYAGQRFTQASTVAQFSVDYAPELIVPDNSEFDSTHPAYKYATDMANLKGGSLTAAGGWCAPSETIYDLCQLESTDGLLSLPEVRVNRGGIRFTTGPDWADIFTSGGFCFTEAEDIAGTYGVNEIQTATEGGAGLTSFTLTFSGQTTASIPVDSSAAVVSAALQALSNIGPGNVNVTSSGSAGAVVYTITFVNALGNTNVAQMTSTPTGGSGTVTIATVQQGGGSAGTKPCATVPCPPFTDVRLNVCGICVNSGILMNSAYPELVRRYVSGALTAHVHRLNTNVIASLVAQSTAVTLSNVQPGQSGGAVEQLLGALELEAEDIRYRRRMSRNSVLEVVLPYWVRGAIRQDFSVRGGVLNPYGEATDAAISNWFAMRGISPQFVYDWQNLGAAGAAVAWPRSVQFLIYPAGTFVRGTSSLVTLNNLYDSTLYSNNNFIAIFTEEGWSVMKMCPESRVVTVPLCYSGGSVLGQLAPTC